MTFAALIFSEKALALPAIFPVSVAVHVSFSFGIFLPLLIAITCSLLRRIPSFFLMAPLLFIVIPVAIFSSLFHNTVFLGY
jgi:hypothetical protein